MFRVLAVFLLAAVPAAAHTITGTVVGPDGKLSGISVRFHYERDPGAVGYATVSDAQGRFSGPAPEEILFLEAIPPEGSRFEHFYDPIGLTITRDRDVRIRLRRIVQLRGDIRAAGGGAVNGTVALYSLTRPLQSDHSRAEPIAVVDTTAGIFSVEVPGDFYSIHVKESGKAFSTGRLNVDARSDRFGLRVTLDRGDGHLMPREAIRADRLSITAPDSAWRVTVTGLSGATDAYSAVNVVNMMTGQSVAGVSDGSGAFTLLTLGAPDATLAVFHDPTGWYLPLAPNNATGVPAVFVSVPALEGETATASSMISTALDQAGALQVEIYGALDGGQWIVRGPLSDLQWSPGETITMQGTMTLVAGNLGSDVSGVTASGSVSLEHRFDAEGRQRNRDRSFFGTDLTPTGMPIERLTQSPFLGPIQITNLRSAGAGRAEADWSATFTLPPLMPPGRYQPLVQMSIGGIPNEARFLDAPVSVGGSAFAVNALWPLVTVGAPQPSRLFFALAVNDFDNGVRGVVAREDRDAYQLSNHVALQTDGFVLPFSDPRTGIPIRHRLEPFLPLFTGFDSFRCASPVPFRFPSGELRVRVHRPGGVIDDLGSAAFRQLESRLPLTRSGLRIALGTAGFPAMYELTTLDPRFEYEFRVPGRHIVELTGSITDIWGNDYEGGGTYEVIAGRTLDIDGGVMIGTPFESGNVFAVSAALAPPVPADVEIRLLHLPGSDPEKAVEHVVRTRANRFGHVTMEGIPLHDAGEFRVDVRATYTDEEGMTWHGEVRWGSVVATTASPVTARGRRGFQDASEIGQQWFFFTDDGQQPGDHVMYPFHGGDVMWMVDTIRFSGLADSPAASLQDTGGALESRVREIRSRFPVMLGSQSSFDDRLTAGEIPLFSSGRDFGAQFGWTPPTQWGYAYLYAERPSVRVREFITEDSVSAAYWRFRDNYHFQPGNGINGDLPNDFKFQFAGTVWRDEEDGFRHYGAYASLFVLLPEPQTPDGGEGRIMPPFQGNGGGPSGGPLFQLKGRDIDLFFHPTAVRPGTILHRGAIASFAGYSAPTLPSKIEIVVTSPTGRVRTISGQANTIGYFHDPSQNFTAGESGVWKARVRIVFDGRTSAGQVTEPFPTGDVLGSRSGEFYFYVVDANADDLSLAPMAKFVRPADGPITFSIEKPAGLTNAQLTYTTTMPGFILEEGTKTSLTYTYDAQKLAKDFPNLDLHDTDGYAGVDPITISFLVSGTQDGKTRHYARQVVIQGEELQMPEQDPGPPKRRAVR